MSLWIPVTLAAATFQILRTARQHQLRDDLTVFGAGYVRFVYGLPFALLLAFVTFLATGSLPTPTTKFWLFVLGGGIVQILGTVALLRSFELRSFALGTVFSKTEVVQVAVISSLVLGEPLQPYGWIGAVICMVGVGWLVAPDGFGQVIAGVTDPGAWMGALAGGLFAASAVGIRGAAGSLEGSAWARAIVTLTLMLALQTVINGLMLHIMSGESPMLVARAWRKAWVVGLLSLCGSASWAFAIALTNAAKVRTLGQIELVIGFVISIVWLREQHTHQEYAASALVLAGIVIVVLVG